MVYKCSVCGYVFDEEKEGKSISEITECPLCKQPVKKLEPVQTEANNESKAENAAESVEEKATGTENTENLDLSYQKDTRKTDGSYRYMKEIHEMAVTG